MLRRRPAGSPSLLYHPQVFGAGGSGSEPVSDHRNGIEWRASLPSLSPLQRILLTMIHAVGAADDSQKQAAGGGRRSEPDRDSGAKGGRGSRMGPIRDVLCVGDLLPPLGMAEDCRGDSWTSLFLPGSVPRESNYGCIPNWLGSEPNFRRLHGIAAVGCLRRHLCGRSGFLFRPAEGGERTGGPARGEVLGNAQSDRAVCDLLTR